MMIVHVAGTLRRAVVLVAAFAVSSVVVAPAASAQTATVQTAHTDMTFRTTLTSGRATATCPTNTFLLGGGSRLSVTATGLDVSNDGSVILGKAPSDPSGNESSNGAQNPQSWTAIAGYTSPAPGTDTVTSYAMCSDSVTAATIVQAIAPITAVSGRTVVACPAGDSLLGGGGGVLSFTGSPTAGPMNVKLADNYPSDSAGNILPTLSRNPAAWTARANDPSTISQGGSSTWAFAICATDVPVNTEVVTASSAPVTGIGATASATVSCPTGTSLLSGGEHVDIGGGAGTPGQDTHVIGDYPSDASGNAATVGSPSAWTAKGQTGSVSASTTAQAIALCDTDFPAQVPETAHPALLIGIGGLLVGGYVLRQRRRAAIA